MKRPGKKAGPEFGPGAQIDSDEIPNLSIPSPWRPGRKVVPEVAHGARRQQAKSGNPQSASFILPARKEKEKPVYSQYDIVEKSTVQKQLTGNSEANRTKSL